MDGSFETLFGWGAALILRVPAAVIRLFHSLITLRLGGSVAV